MYIENINSPNDIKKLNNEQLNILCSEIREYMISCVSNNGGHLASNLGTVELTVAMHKVFDSPKDQFVFDVGHQCYTHKIITGRREQLKTLRQEDGISGFTRIDENEHDIFSSGHSSTSISAAIGLAKAKTLNHEKGKVVAIIGDGALTGGLAYEAINNCGTENDNLVVILNDNNMSISQNVGALAKHLTSIRTSSSYFNFKSIISKIIKHIPKVGGKIAESITRTNRKIRKKVYKSTFFEDFGFRYYGPIDGHNLDALIDALEIAKLHRHSVLIHVDTIKGKGYEHAELDPSKFHGIGKFDINTGEPVYSSKSFSDAFGDKLVSIADENSKVCAITAAMMYGTGLEKFAKHHRDRFFDVGIAEQHAVTFASGLARNGMIPFFAVYSTFLQRSYDQIIHDVAMQGLKVIFCIDRAGFVGNDGESHQGLFDTSFLMSVPNLVVLAPTYFDELEKMMEVVSTDAINGPVAIRYPRGTEPKQIDGYVYGGKTFDTFGDVKSKKCIVTYGRQFSNCYSAFEELDDVFLVKLNVIKPIDEKVFSLMENCEEIYFYEESIKDGSVGTVFAERLEELNINVKFKHFAVNNQFVKQATVNRQIEMFNLDKDSIIKEVK